MLEKLHNHPPADIIRAFVARQFVGPVDEQLVTTVAERMAATSVDVARAAWAAMIRRWLLLSGLETGTTSFG